MPKSLVRIIAFLLIPCLLQQTVLSAQFPAPSNQGLSAFAPLFVSQALMSRQFEGWRETDNKTNARVTSMAFAVSAELWPGMLLKDARLGGVHLLKLAATGTLDWVEERSKKTFELIKTGRAEELVEFILGRLGPGVETAEFLTAALIAAIEAHTHKQGDGNSKKKARNLINPLIKNLAQRHGSELFRKGEKGEVILSPVKDGELEELEELMKDWAKPLYDLFDYFYSLPIEQRKKIDFKQRLTDALSEFTSSHRDHNLMVHHDKTIPVGTAYLVAQSPKARPEASPNPRAPTRPRKRSWRSSNNCPKPITLLTNAGRTPISWKIVPENSIGGRPTSFWISWRPILNPV